MITLEKVNTLPVATWHRFGLNSSSLELPLQKVPAYRNASAQKANVQILDYTDACRQEIPGSYTSILNNLSTGMGEETADFAEHKANAGFSIRLLQGTKIVQPIVFNYTLNSAYPVLAERNILIAEEGSSVTLVQIYRSAASHDTTGRFHDQYPDPAAIHTHGGVTKIIAEKNARVTLIQIQLLDREAVTFDDVGILAREDANVSVIQAELGGGRTYAGVRASLEGKRATTHMHTLYLGDHEQYIDLNYIAEHIGQSSCSEITAYGALRNSAVKLMRSTIDFKTGAGDSTGAEKEHTILFNAGVQNRSAPLILCGEENVEGSHAASAGRIDEGQLFYLMSRGFSEAEARRLIVEASFEPVLALMPNTLRGMVREQIKRKLNTASVGEAIRT